MLNFIILHTSNFNLLFIHLVQHLNTFSLSSRKLNFIIVIFYIYNLITCFLVLLWPLFLDDLSSNWILDS